ncbi:carbohydrate ABC transporter permease [Streptomyces iranensis]|uniref:carbohydrate ABC transporter permease n=1 Tax=Streptomyces iranensis TaxID=576784 RepID=UPI0039B74F74
MVAAGVISLLDWNLFSPPHFIGLDNFARLGPDPTFWSALGNTAYFTFVSVPLTLLVSLGLAVLLNQGLRRMAVFRSLLLLPYATITVAVAFVWVWLYIPHDGLINAVLGGFGIDGPAWLISDDWAMPALIVLVAKLHGVDTWPGMILPHAFTALGVFLLRQFFLGVPRDYEEAARLDGANRWQTFIRVIVPLAVPAIATLAVFKFISQWNNLLWPLVISNSDSTRTAAVGLQVFQSTNGTQWNLLLMAAAITTVPLIVLFFLTQRWFVKGITMSGLGGR